MAVLQKVKSKVAGYDPYDGVSNTKNKLNKILLVVKLVLMVGIFVAFAVYDSQNPVVTLTSTTELPFTLPHIFIEYAQVTNCSISTVSFNVASGWDPNNLNSSNILCKDYFEELKPNVNKKPASTYAFYLNATEKDTVDLSRFQMRVSVSNCSWGPSKEVFYTVFDPDSLHLYADNLGSCGFQSYINVRKQIFFRPSGKKDIQYTLTLNGFAPQRAGGISANDALLNFMFDNTVLDIFYYFYFFSFTTEETPFGLFKRIVTDAGGLFSVVVLIVTLLEFIVIRSLFDEPEFYFPHNLRETVLWITDPGNKKNKLSSASLNSTPSTP